jgi:4-hydroxy-3-polyprenylbenzoate decarboxylase
MTIFQSLGAFVDHLDRTGELVRITQPVAVDLEMAEISDRTMKLPGGGPALLFEKPVLADGSISRIPVAINVFGSWSRISAALGVTSLEEHATRIAELIKPDVPKGFWAKLQRLPERAELAVVPPRG